MASTGEKQSDSERQEPGHVEDRRDNDRADGIEMEENSRQEILEDALPLNSEQPIRKEIHTV